MQRFAYLFKYVSFLLLLATGAAAQDPAPVPMSDEYGNLDIGASQIPDSSELNVQLDWPAEDGAYYFVEHTEDLLESFASIKLFAGSRANSAGNLGTAFQTSGPMGFYRLFITKDENHPRLLADDDGDTISNLLEAQAGFDAFSSVDGDFNHLPDDWELFWKDQFAIYPDALAASLSHRESTTQQLYLHNPVSPDADFTVTVSNNLAGAQVVYDYEDSLTGAVSYNWTEISSTGTRLDDISETDDGHEAVTLSNFTFPFDGTSYSAVFVSSNGILAFGSGTSNHSNQSIPNTSNPNNFIAPFWDDLNTSTAGEVYVQELSDRLILQYEAVAPYSGTGSYTYQAVLHSSGSIEFFYKEMVGNLASATIGLENADGTDGLEIAYNEPYIQDGLAVRISQSPAYFVKVSPLTGTTNTGATSVLNVTFNTFDLAPGRYTADIDLAHTGTGTTPWTIPAVLEVTNPPTQIAITSPQDGTVFWSDQSLSINVSASDDDFGIERVEFFYDDTKFHEDSSPSYYYYWPNPSIGTYALTARAVDPFGTVTISDPVTITVLEDSDSDRMEDGWERSHFGDLSQDPLGDYDGDGAANLLEYHRGTDPTDPNETPVNQPSVIVLTEPEAAYTVLQGDSIRLEADVSDPDTELDRVDFYYGDSFIGSDTSVNYGSASRSWYNAPPGTHSLTARAVDIYGTVTISDPVTITVLEDADSDRMDDAWENQYFGGLLAEALADADSDRYPNIFEYHNGTNPTDTEDYPSFSTTQNTVSPVTGIGSVNYFRVYSGASNSGFEWDSIQGALNIANNVGEGFDIIEVLPGTYNEDIQLSEPIYLFSRDGARSTIIDGTGRNDSVVDLFSESVIDGFTIQNGGSTSNLSNGAGMYVSAGNNQTDLRVIGCLFVNNEASSRGGAVYVSSGDIAFVSCSLIDNLSPEGAAIYSGSNSNDIRFINTLLWNDALTNGDEIEGSINGVSYQKTLYRETETGKVFIDMDDQNTQNPGITPYYGIYHSSPAKDAGIATEYSSADFDGEARDDGLIDIGVDEAVDTNGDGIAEAWMAFYGFTDPSANTDTDRLTHLQEYQNQTDPLNGDTDGDLLTDSDEIFVTGTDPLVADTEELDTDLNLDGIDDSLGLLLGISLTEDNNDGDTLTNAEEAALGTDPTKTDTDSDGANDDVDDFPLDPTRTFIGSADPSDSAAPSIFLRKPPGATLL